MRRRRGARAAAGDAGFTAIEMIVSLLIIGIVATGFLSTLVGTVTSARIHEDRTRANQLAQNLLEAVVTQPWANIGLYSTDTNYRATAGSPVETTVALSISPRPASVPLPLTTTTVGGQWSYTIRTDITWRDDPADGTGISDANGNGNDLKHVVITVSWIRNGTHSVTLDDLRAPTATEVPPSSVTTTTVSVSAPATQQLAATGNLASAMTVTATTSRVVTSVTLSFTTRNGTQSVAMTNTSGGTSWSVTLPTTTGPFDTGPANFTATATNGTTTSIGTASVQLAIGATISVAAAPSQQLAVGSILSAPIVINVTSSGSTTISSGSVTFATRAGNVTRPLSGSGSSWSLTIPVDSTVYNAGTETFTVSVTLSNATTATGTASISLFDANLPPDVTSITVFGSTKTPPAQNFCLRSSNNTLWAATDIQATVNNIATTDTVRLTAPALTTQEFPMTYVKTNADGSMVFHYLAATSIVFPTISSLTLQAYALKTISGTQYRDDYITSPAPTVQRTSASTSCLQ